MDILIADDEAHARARIRTLLADLAEALKIRVVAEVANGEEAVRAALVSKVDVALRDIQMPAMDGLTAARHLMRLPEAPAVVFLTAHDEHALAAFDLGAGLPAQARAGGAVEAGAATGAEAGGWSGHLVANDRGQIILVPLADVVRLKAEDKYVAVVTSSQTYWLDESLQSLEQEFAGQLLRIHRACLVNREFLAGFELDSASGRWHAVLKGVPERPMVSRRQAHVVKMFRNGSD
ncbi:MAG: LytTR family DNA-binding domain-containing protein [Rhodocyclaceae bacterium]|jgi:two-component system response regulator AlgR|nr:LytTR family DNA-binding domain-containing protein [Rhodocyclaceae bacterium]